MADISDTGAVGGGRWVSAAEAAALLAVRPQTIYAYVTRGLIRSAPGEGRESRYSLRDIKALAAKRQAGRSPAVAARASLDWGLPVLESAICLIEGGRLYYRGQEVGALLRREPGGIALESVAALLWQQPEEAVFGPENMPAVSSYVQRMLPNLAELPWFPRVCALLAMVETAELAALDRSPPGLARSGARILRWLAAAAAGGLPQARPLADQLAICWRVSPARTRALRAALALVADHELNPSTFTVRGVIATGATPYAAVAAGLAALSGPLHGGATLQAEALFREIGEGAVATVLAERLRRGERLPGFGHPLYPAGDPRAGILLQILAEAAPGKATERAREIAMAAEQLTGAKPNIDFALAALVHGLGLPAGAGVILFSIGRTAGWIGHGIEQAASGRMIRPRAAYIGPRPASIEDAVEMEGGT